MSQWILRLRTQPQIKAQLDRMESDSMDKIHFTNWLRELANHSPHRIWIPCQITKMVTNFKSFSKARDHLAAQIPTILPKGVSSMANMELRAKWRVRILLLPQIIIIMPRIRLSSSWFKCRTPASLNSRWADHIRGQVWHRERALEASIQATTTSSQVQLKTFFWMRKRTITTKILLPNNIINSMININFSNTNTN